MDKLLKLKWNGPVPLSSFIDESALQNYLNSNEMSEYSKLLDNRGVYLMCHKLIEFDHKNIYCVNYVGGAPIRSIKHRLYEHYWNIKNAEAGGYFSFERKGDLFPFDMLYTIYFKEFIKDNGHNELNINKTEVFFYCNNKSSQEINDFIGKNNREKYSLKELSESGRKNYIEQIEHALINSFRSRALTRFFSLNTELVCYNVPYPLIHNDILDKSSYIIGLGEITEQDYKIFIKYLETHF